MSLEDFQKKIEENKVDLTIKDPNLFDEMEGDPDTEFEFIRSEEHTSELHSQKNIRHFLEMESIQPDWIISRNWE